MDALAVMLPAEIAAGAGRDLLCRHADFFDFMTAFRRAPGELNAQKVGIAAPAGAAGENQDFLAYGITSVS